MRRLSRMFDGHPNPASDAGAEAFALVQAAAECAHVCTTCADACLEEEDPASMRRCIRTNLDCAHICTVTSLIVARPGRQDAELLRAQLQACATACRACADECDKHSDDMDHCGICAESCRKCAEVCEEMIAAVVPA